MTIPRMLFTVYLLAANLFAAGITLYDKHAARKGAWRIKERTLLLAALLGGSALMYVVMKLIRHKTQHVKFMAGIPAICVLQLIVCWILKDFI